MGSEGHIDLHWFSLQVDHERLRELAAYLSDDERERARRLRFPRDTDRFVAARGTLREILASLVGRDPRELVFTYGPHGKPRLGGESHTLDFSLSHSGGSALLAVSDGPRIGADIEEIRDDPMLESVARFLFSSREIEALGKISAADRLHAFYRCWTCKEAFVKATGAGLGADMASFEVAVSARDSARLLSVNDSEQEAARWTLGHVALGDDVAAAFAVEAALCSVSLSEWRGGRAEASGQAATERARVSRRKT